MGICNYCKLKEHRRRAERVGRKVKTFPSDGWQKSYEYPKDVDIDSLSPEEREQYASGSQYLEVSLGCAC